MPPHSTQLDLETYRQIADWAWAAGLFEGEGTIYTALPSKRHQLEVRLCRTPTDEDVVRHFKAVVGAGSVTLVKKQQSHFKQAFVWQLFGTRALPRLRRLLPWFGDRRSRKAAEALELGARLSVDNKLKTHCPHGHPYDAENTAVRQGHRKCRAGERLRAHRRRQRGRNKLTN